MTCRNCGAAVADRARFCSQCGTAQVDNDERRVVTALFADIVGFTALAERRDPEEVKRIVDRCFESLARDISSFGGVVDKVMGDGIIALFGAPTAHEDDAERAVRSALRMQQSLADVADSASDPTPIRMRIGINTGEVLVGTSTAGGDYTAMGDVMNTASRLEQLAEPGQVIVGDSTHQLTNRAIQYRAVGPFQAKGKEQPLEAWEAVAVTRPPGFHRKASEQFVGRRRELSLLEAQGRLAFELGQSQLTVIVGEAGMGKSRLVDELSVRLRERYAAAVWKSNCVPYGEANVWWPVAEIVRRLFSLDIDASQAQAEQVIAARLTGMVGPDGPSPDRIRTALLHALGYPTSLRGGDPIHNRAEVTQAFSQLLEVELNERPVMIVIFDLHWAGEAVWDLFDRLLNQWGRNQLMILATARAMERTSLFEGRHGTAVIQLGPLSDGAARDLLASLHQSGDEALDGETVDLLVARSGGNPYFLEELAGLVLGGDSTPAGVAGQLGDLPDTLRGIIAARLDDLEPGERSLLEDAAVLGRSGPVVGLQLLSKARRGVDSIDHELSGLVDKDLLSTDGSRYEFRSELVRDVAYGTLTKAARAFRHRDIARYLEGRQTEQVRNSVVAAIADHYRAAARLSIELRLMGDGERAELVSRALMWLQSAGERAMSAGEAVEAEVWFGSGIDLAIDGQTEASFLHGRARARCEIHDIAGARADLAKLQDLATHDPLLAAKALLITGDVSRKAGDLGEAAQQLREAADKLAVLGATTEQSLALRLLGLTEMARSDGLLALQAFEASREVAAKAGDRRSEAWTLQSMAWLAFSQGRVHDANRQAATAIEVFVQLGDRSGLAWAQGVQAWVAFHLGQLGTAQELVDDLLPSVRRRGDPAAEALMLNLAASLALWTGRANEAVTLCSQAVEAARRSDDSGLETQTLAVQGRALVSLGRITDGSATLERAFRLAERNRDHYNRRIAIIANCASAARVGEAERAMQWASHFDGFHDDLSVVGEADLIVSMAMALLQRGAVDEAASQLAWIEDGRRSRLDYYAEAVRAMIAAANGQYDEVEAATEQVLEGPSTYLDRVTVLLAQAGARRRSGDDAGCDAALSGARDVVSGTDDRMSRWLIELVAGLCGRTELAKAETKMANAGLDPAGLVTAWRLIIDSTPADDELSAGS